MKSFNEVIRSGKPVLVDFFAEWCGPCKMMPPILKQVKEKFGDGLVVLKVDIDKNPETARQLDIQGVPTLMLFKDGAIQWRQSGVIPAHQLISTLTAKTGLN